MGCFEKVLALKESFQFATLLCRIECDLKMLKEAIHSQKASSRKFLRKCRSDYYLPTWYVEHYVVKIGMSVASDTCGFLNFPFFYSQTNEIFLCSHETCSATPLNQLWLQIASSAGRSSLAR